MFVPSVASISRLIGTPCAGQKQKKTNSGASLSLVRCPLVWLLPRHRFSPRHRFGPVKGKAFVPLCPIEPHRAPRVNPGAHRGPRSLHNVGAQTAMLSQLGRKNKHRWNLILLTD